MDESDLHDLKADRPISIMDLGISNEESSVQSEKASLPIFVTELGIKTEVNGGLSQIIESIVFQKEAPISFTG